MVEETATAGNVDERVPCKVNVQGHRVNNNIQFYTSPITSQAHELTII
jgi:hypothetical protein